MRRRAPVAVRVPAMAAAGLTAMLVLLVALVPAAAAAPGRDDAADGASRAATRRVLIVTAPRLTWEEVHQVRPPHLMRFLSEAAMASTSVRTAGSATRPGDAYLTIGAGNRMGTVPSVDGAIIARTESLEQGNPTQIFERTAGRTATGQILVLGKPAIDRVNREEQYFGAAAGALASALDDAGRSVAVIGNADRSFDTPQWRQVALAAMDRTGQVDEGAIGPELLRVDPPAPWGLSIDPNVYLPVFERFWSTHDVVVAELSDLERAEAARSDATEEQADRQFRRALRRSDQLFGAMLDHVDLRRDTVLFVAPTAPMNATQLTVFAMAGPGIEVGWATSSTTRRQAYVTLTDLAPSTLARLGVAVPDEMNDTRLRMDSVGDASTPAVVERIDQLVEWNTRAVTRDAAFGATTVVFIVVLVVDVALAILCLARFRRLAVWVRAIALAVLALPPATYLLGLVPITSPAVLGIAVAAASIALALVASLTVRWSPILPPVLLSALLWLVLAVDVVTGERLQVFTVFGYSPMVAGRFAGFGNQAFSMISLSALVVAAAWLDRAEPAGERPDGPTTATVIGWYAVTVVLVGHPAFGSDVGGVLAFVPAATVSVLAFAGVRLRPRVLALIATGTIAILAVFAAIDVSRPAESRTHLGRSVTKLFDGQAGEILERKIAANLRVLGSSVWSWVIPVALLYFAYLTWRPNRTLQRLNQRYPHFRAFGVSALTLGALAMALNDSGVSLPGIMLVLSAAYVSYLVVDLERSSPAP